MGGVKEPIPVPSGAALAPVPAHGGAAGSQPAYPGAEGIHEYPRYGRAPAGDYFEFSWEYEWMYDYDLGDDGSLLTPDARHGKVLAVDGQSGAQSGALAHRVARAVYPGPLEDVAAWLAARHRIARLLRSLEPVEA